MEVIYILAHQLILLFICIILKGWVTAVSTALRVLDLKKAKYISETDKTTEEKLTLALEKSETYNNAASVVTAIMGISIGVLLCFGISDSYRAVISGINILSDAYFDDFIISILLIIAFVYLFAFVSIVLPKFLADQYPDKLVLKSLWLLKFFSVILFPIVWVVDLSYKLISKIFNADSTETEEVSEGEILMMVDAGGESGGIDEIEKEMINNIFEFDDKIVGEIATHRKDIVGLDISSGLDDVVKIITLEKYSRIPVYEENIDNIIGVLHTKDFMTRLIVNGSEGFDLQKLLREPVYIPFNKKTDELFSEMQKNKFHMAIIVDEYGGTAGIVTMEDLIEEIMGNIEDEYDEEEPPEIAVYDDSIVIDGKTSLEDVADELGIDMPVEEYDTMGGFIIGQMGRIPDEFESVVVNYSGYVFDVISVEAKRIVSVKVTKAEDGDGDENAEE